MFRVYCKYALLKGTSTMFCSFCCIDAWICVLVLAVAYTCVGDAAVLQPICAVSSGATLECHEAI